MAALKPSYQEQLIAIICKHIPYCEIILFGSYATGQQTASSDIDLAIKTEKPIPYKKIIAIQQDIDETTIPLKVDIIDMHTVQEAIKKNILREGITWWKN